jgi:hypothetical protein
MTGTKDLNPMTTNKFSVLFIIGVVIYFISDYFFTDAMLYLTGGLIGGTIKELIKQATSGLIVAVWLALLAIIIFLYYRLSSKPVKYVMLLLIACLLYIVDFILMEAINFNVVDLTTSILNIAIRVISKALILALIIRFGQKHIKSKAAQ